MDSRIQRYFNVLGNLPLATQVTDRQGKPMPLEKAFTEITARMRQAHTQGNTLLFIGNGGSAAIASHMANDFSKNGGLRAMAFNDGVVLTCLSNDLGYENVFARQMEMHARPGDVLVAISSSGKSPNIIKAVDEARARGCYIVTLSGFAFGNPLRTFGDCNLYVNSGEYGFVEITHLALCHAILDLHMGWGEKIEEEQKALAS
ncbi:MAG: SIS domain-containing protein [Pseudomonadota bacterium]|nr:SIS domain-containing protein [Pseudomonadota bacterium]